MLIHFVFAVHRKETFKVVHVLIFVRLSDLVLRVEPNSGRTTKRIEERGRVSSWWLKIDVREMNRTKKDR